MKAEVEPLLLKKNWTHLEGSLFPRYLVYSDDVWLRAIMPFFEQLVRLNTTYRVTRVSLPTKVLPALLSWLTEQKQDIRSLSELILYDDCDDVHYGSEDDDYASARKRLLMDKVESLVSLGHDEDGFLPNKLGVVLRFEIFVTDTEVSLLLRDLRPAQC